MGWKISRMRIPAVASVLITLTIASCVFIHKVHFKPVNKSVNDEKRYRYMVLPNGLRTLLISDKDADIASAAMDVYVGSAQDPEDLQGLAHFAEHMLFLGTKKYPEAGSYQAFIKENGGTTNASTGFEHTNFHFSAKSAALPDALDRFAQFFIAPTFDVAYVGREVKSIHAEFSSKIKSDGRRVVDVYKTLTSKEHPFHKFQTGNHDTLGDDSERLMLALKDFHQRYYSATNMTLVVNGKASLDSLQQMVETAFSAVPRRKVVHEPMPQSVFDDGFLPKWVNVQPEKQLKTLTLSFPVPDYSKDFQSKPLMLMGHILGHEGKGSLYSFLKGNNWIESLVAGNGLAYNGGGTFMIKMQLTEAGLQHQQAIVLAVFQAINRLKTEGLPRWVFDELAEINHLSFLYPEESSPLSRAVYLSHEMHYYPASRLLEAGYLLTKFAPGLIREAMGYLTPDNLLVTMVAPGFTAVEHTAIYKTPYTVSHFPSPLIKRIEKEPLNEAIVMPLPNELLPDKLVKPKVKSTQEYPVEVLAEKKLSVWHKPVVNFQTPRVTGYYAFESMTGQGNLEESVALDVYVELLNRQLEELGYAAYLAGMNFNWYRNSSGIVLSVEGFSEQQKRLISEIVDNMKRMTFTQEHFNTVVRESAIKLANRQLNQPFRLLLTTFEDELRPDQWSDRVLMDALSRLTLKAVGDVSARFFEGARVTTLSDGDIAKEQAIDTARLLAKGLVKPNDSPVPLEIRIRRLGALSYRYVETPYADTGYLYYWQAEDNSVETRADWLILAAMMEQGYYHSLRTQQQLGYVVSAKYYSLVTVPGIIFLVQSPVAGVVSLHQRTRVFLDEFFTGLESVAQTSFDGYRQSLIEQLSEKPKNLHQEAGMYWGELMTGLSFDRKLQLVARLQALDFNGWKQRVSAIYLQRDHHAILMGTQDAAIVESGVEGLSKPDAKSGYFIYRARK